MNIKSIFQCPCCGKNLRLEVETNFLYCGSGPCQVSEMNDGAKGSNERESYHKLIIALESLTESGKYVEPSNGWFYHRKGTLPYLRPTGVSLVPAPITPTSPNYENTDIAKLATPSFEEMTGSD